MTSSNRGQLNTSCPLTCLCIERKDNMSASIKQYFSTQAAVSGCYPTPTDLIDRLLDGVNWGKISTVLEPSAGFGDMIEAVMTKAHIHG